MSSVFKLLTEAEKRWKKLYGHKKLADVIEMKKFVDGVDENTVLTTNNNGAIEDAA